MSPLIKVRRTPQVRIDSMPLRRMQEACRQGASATAERMGPAAQRSREYAAERMLEARGWSAPRLERAAGYVEQDLAPRVSGFLSDTAHRIEPPKPANRARNAALVMLAAIGAVGLAGAAMSRRTTMEPMESAQVPEPAPAGYGATPLA